MSEPAASVIFSTDELWLLQSVIRHEMAQPEQWKAPPFSASLNEQVGEALVLCHDHDQGEAAVLLTMADCLAIDYCVPQSAKSPSGNPIGKQVLLKSFRARAEVAHHWASSQAEPEDPSHDELITKLDQWKRRRGKRSA